LKYKQCKLEIPMTRDGRLSDRGENQEKRESVAYGMWIKVGQTNRETKPASKEVGDADADA